MAKERRDLTTQVSASSQVDKQPSTQTAAFSVTQAELSVHMGPFPSASELRELEELYPGATKIIFEQYQKRGDHRMHLERTVIEGENRRAYIGQVFAFVLSLVGFGTAGYYGFIGHAVEGASIAGGVIIGLATVFLKADKDRREERKAKAELMTKQKRSIKPE